MKIKDSVDVFFTFIVPVVRLNDLISENVTAVLNQDFQDWNMIIVTDEFEDNPWSDSRIILINSGKVSPGKKRDLAAKLASGKFLVFLDDDSYISSNYCFEAHDVLKIGSIEILGGPGVTPPRNGLLQKASGNTLESKWLGGKPERYLPIGSIRKVEDWPSVNLIVNSHTFNLLGGFGTKYWPGEDSKFCEKANSFGIDIWYDPRLVVFHHRRNNLRSHLRQISSYAYHRGHFFRMGDTNSRSWTYLIPSIWLIYLLVFVFLLIIFDIEYTIYSIPIFIYVLLLMSHFLNTIMKDGVTVSILSIPYIILTHLSYGFHFMCGYLKPFQSFGSSLRK